ncbi:hypothetical protein PO909_000770, partial [Leuciscus waleckii]
MKIKSEDSHESSHWEEAAQAFSLKSQRRRLIRNITAEKTRRCVFQCRKDLNLIYIFNLFFIRTSTFSSSMQTQDILSCIFETGLFSTLLLLRCLGYYKSV